MLRTELTKFGKKGERTRRALLDATEEVMVTEGYAAVTTRKVASKVGVTPGVVHYYFPTTEDLLLATYRRAAQHLEERIRGALQSDAPLRTLWRSYLESTAMTLAVEMAAMAIHRDEIREEMAHNIERTRRMQEKAFAIVSKEMGLSDALPPESASLLLYAVARTLVQERMLGVAYGANALVTFVDALIERIETHRSGFRG